MTVPLEQSILAALPDAVVSIDRASRILFANDAALRLFGFSADEFIGRPLAETIIPPDLRAQHARGMERYQATGSGPVIGRRIDITACDRGGRRFPIELSVFLDSTRPGEVFHAAIRETSDRVARDAVVTAERERLRQILDATADAWWDCTVDGATRYSDSAAKVLGCDAASVPECDPASLPWIEPHDRSRVADAWRAHLAGEVGRFECTHRVNRPDGTVRWFRQRGRAVEFALGRPLRIVGTIADVTEQQSAEERLRNAQRLEMLGLLAGGFAHDLNNMLAAIRGHAALAATEPGVTPAAIESLASIQLATTKAKMLTSNMLSLGKPSVEAVSRFPLRAAIEETLDLVRPNMPRSIAVSADLAAASELGLELDPSAFQQALLNLVINARDAMPGGGRLRIEATPIDSPSLGACARITVEDTGVGMPPELLGRVFEPFFTTKPQGVGTGLGLAVVQRVAVGAGGTVTVASDAGRGTRFTLILPAHRLASDERPSAEPQPAPCTVLLAESHSVLRPMLCEALRSAGHTVVESDGGAHAVRAALDRSRGEPGKRVSVLVAEFGSGAMSGERLHAQIESAIGARLPAVLMASDPSATLEGQSSIHAAPQSSPAAARSDILVLQKPFDIGELVEAIARVMQGRARA